MFEGLKQALEDICANSDAGVLEAELKVYDLLRIDLNRSSTTIWIRSGRLEEIKVQFKGRALEGARRAGRGEFIVASEECRRGFSFHLLDTLYLCCKRYRSYFK